MSDGIPSPNPTYKQDIHNVSGEVEEVIGNKNLFDKTTVTSNKYIDDADGKAKNASNLNASDYIHIKGIENIRISSSMTGSQWGAFYDKNKQYISGFNSYLSAKTVPTNACYMRITVSNSALDNMQLEPGTTATSYFAHEQQTYDFTLSQGQKMYKGDYLADDGIHHVRGEYALQGEDIARLNTQGESYISVIVNKFAEILNKESAINILCNMLKASSSTIVNSLRIVTTSGNIVLIFSSDFAEYNITAVRTKIQNLYDNGTPLVIEIPLSQEVIEPYTTLQQEQYNLIKKAKAYQDVTIINGKSNDADPNVKIQYFKKETENTIPLGLSVSPITDTNFVENDEEIMQVEELNTESEDFEESEEIENNETDT